MRKIPVINCSRRVNAHNLHTHRDTQTCVQHTYEFSTRTEYHFIIWHGKTESQDSGVFAGRQDGMNLDLGTL